MIAIKKYFAALLGVLLLSALAAQSQAQTYRVNSRTVRQLIIRLEADSAAFRDVLNAQTDSRIYARGENLSNLATDLSTATRRLRVDYNQRRSTTSDVQDVLNRAVLIDQFVNARNISNSVVIRRWANLKIELNQLANYYNVSWPTISQTYPNNSQNNYPYPNNRIGYGANLLTGTYRLDPSQSDDPQQAADRAIATASYGTRDAVRDRLAARLQSPDEIAIDVRGNQVTLASSRAPQISFSADGTERVETTNSGRTIRARATLSGDQLLVSTTGDLDNEFNVTFNPIDNGRRLSVTRRVYVQGLSRPVSVQSTYNKESDVARFDVFNGTTYPNNNPSPQNNTDFIINNGETVVAVLNDDLSTATAREGDRFTATVRLPTQFAGAMVEGHVSNVQRSGRLTGRSQMTLNFDDIRLNDGRTYRFAGLVDSVRDTEGEVVRVDNEGAVRDNSQTTRTAERAAIGTAVGAIIGAIAGGGKGAAIGAIVGAGGGAGSVYVQGRDDLELRRGAEITIRVTGPRG